MKYKLYIHDKDLEDKNIANLREDLNIFTKKYGGKEKPLLWKGLYNQRKYKDLLTDLGLTQTAILCTHDNIDKEFKNLNPEIASWKRIHKRNDIDDLVGTLGKLIAYVELEKSGRSRRVYKNIEKDICLLFKATENASLTEGQKKQQEKINEENENKIEENKIENLEPFAYIATSRLVQNLIEGKPVEYVAMYLQGVKKTFLDSIGVSEYTEIYERLEKDLKKLKNTGVEISVEKVVGNIEEEE